MKNLIPIYPIQLPEYNLEQRPDFATIAAKLDKIVEEYFFGKWLAVRGVSLQDHPDRSYPFLNLPKSV